MNIDWWEWYTCTHDVYKKIYPAIILLTFSVPFLKHENKLIKDIFQKSIFEFFKYFFITEFFIWCALWMTWWRLTSYYTDMNDVYKWINWVVNQ